MQVAFFMYHSLLWLDWVACICPGGKSAEEGIYFFVAVIQEEERRTGARVFILSGAVGDDPLAFLECEFINIDFEISQRNRDGSRGMTCSIRVCAADVDEGGYSYPSSWKIQPLEAP